MAKNKKISPAKQPAKPVPARAHAPPPKKAPAHKAAPAKPAAGKNLSATDLKRRLLERKTAKPIAFSLDEVREIAKRNEKRSPRPATAAGKAADEAARVHQPPKGASRPPIPHHIKAASVADILGFNPGKVHKTAVEVIGEADVPEKYRRYYRVLVDLRNHVLESLGQHSEETLKRSAKDDAGDLSGYGQHMADAGTDTFDRDFALSLVSNEQEALSEVEAAIERIRTGTYGICELTGKPISRDRLLAVPFTRYSAEAQKELEKTRHRSVQRAGIFSDTTTEEGGKLAEEEPEE
jgi:RNA polymerase-binding transcription factor DksA